MRILEFCGTPLLTLILAWSALNFDHLLKNFKSDHASQVILDCFVLNLTNNALGNRLMTNFQHAIYSDLLLPSKGYLLFNYNL